MSPSHALDFATVDSNTRMRATAPAGAADGGTATPMTFRNDAQRAETCRGLLATLGLQSMWTTLGPSARALAIVAAADNGFYSVEERSLLSIAFELWDGHDRLWLSVNGGGRFDERSEAALRDLVLAFGHGARGVDAWLQVYGVPEFTATP